MRRWNTSRGACALCCLIVAPSARSDESEAEVDAAARRSVAILLELQESLDDGTEAREWPYEGVYRERGAIPLGYRVGGTSIAATALLTAPGYEEDVARQAAVVRALEFVLEAIERPRMEAGFNGSYDVRGWGHAYALDFLLRLRTAGHVPQDAAQPVERAITRLIADLEATAIGSHGGWNYARRGGRDEAAPSTFMTAATLQTLFLAREQGEEVDADVVERGLAALERARLDSGAFQYAVQAKKTGKGFEAVPGAIGRMPICETTLVLAGRGDRARIEESLEAFFEHWQHLEDRRRQTGTHARPYMIAPYYFFFAHRYAAQAIEMLAPGERPRWRTRLLELLWRVREESGGWNDRVFRRSENFGTAMTLLALCQPGSAPPATWTSPITQVETPSEGEREDPGRTAPGER